jgi:hypothetical protein
METLSLPTVLTYLHGQEQDKGQQQFTLRERIPFTNVTCCEFRNKFGPC